MECILHLYSEIFALRWPKGAGIVEYCGVAMCINIKFRMQAEPFGIRPTLVITSLPAIRTEEIILAQELDMYNLGRSMQIGEYE